MKNTKRWLIYISSCFALHALLYCSAIWYSNNVMLVSYVLVVIFFCLFFGVFIFTSDKKLKSFVFSFLFFALNFLVATCLIYLELAMVVGAGGWFRN